MNSQVDCETIHHHIFNPTKMANQIRTLSPSTNEVIFEHQGTSLEEARKIAQASYEAFKLYKKITLSERKDIIVKALELIAANIDTLSNELTTQMGRPIAYSAKEIETMRKRADYLLSIAEDSLQEHPGQLEKGFRRSVKKEPVGPTLIATAWNVRSVRTSPHFRISNRHSTPTSLRSTRSFQPSWPETRSSSVPPRKPPSSANASSHTSPKPVCRPTSSNSSTLAPWTSSARSSSSPKSSLSRSPAPQQAASASVKRLPAALSQ